jgi:hypothetical protein
MFSKENLGGLGDRCCTRGKHSSEKTAPNSIQTPKQSNSHRKLVLLVPASRRFRSDCEGRTARASACAITEPIFPAAAAMP